MKYFKALSATLITSIILAGTSACAINKPIGKITKLEMPVIPSENQASNGIVSITALVTGWVEAPAFILMDQKDAGTPDAYRTPQWVPSITYIVKHPSKGTVIFDFGLKAGDCAYGFKPFYWVPCRNDGYNTLASYLGNNTDVREDITYLIPSHFHGDHISGLSDVMALTSAPLLMTDAALDEISSVKRDFAGIPSRMLEADIKVISMGRSFTPDPVLGRAFDVFDDGSLKVFETPGHSSGHISALARTEKQTVILAFDTAHLRANYDLQIPSGSVTDKAQAVQSLEHLKHIESQLDDVQIIFGHDPEQWQCPQTVPMPDVTVLNKC